MSKTVFVMDSMPENCVSCPIGAWMLHRLVCQASGHYGDKKIRPQECPLREFPEYEDLYDPVEETISDHAVGWNACMNNILGRDEDYYQEGE